MGYPHYGSDCSDYHRVVSDLAALADVMAERGRQTEKWGEQNHDAPVWLAILTEEVGELSEAILGELFGKELNGSHSEDVRTEAVQVAAVALQIVEAIDRATAKAGV